MSDTLEDAKFTEEPKAAQKLVLFDLTVYLSKGGVQKGIAQNIQVTNGLLVATSDNNSVSVYPLANVLRYHFSLIKEVKSEASV